MFHLAYELQCMIMSFLPNNNLFPISRASKPLYMSNVVWKPRVLKKFGNIESTNYFREYYWQIMLEHHQYWYKRQWTLGCVGRVVALKKPTFLPAVI